MNNDELKKKIVDVVAMAILEADELPFVETAEYVADALVAAGIGDVKEAQHYREVAERALLNLCVDTQPYFLFDQTPLVTEASVKMQEYLQQAEKELEEERKDEN